MREVPPWDHYFMNIAKAVALRSKDPSTQVGALIVDRHNHPIAFGYNGFAPGVQESDQLWERPEKYDRVLHAESNAIAHAAKAGRALDASILYVTHLPCLACCKIIIAAGIIRVIFETDVYYSNSEKEKVFERFAEVGVQLGIILD